MLLAGSDCSAASAVTSGSGSDSEYDRYRLLRLGDELTLGIGIYDDRKVAIGAFNKTGNGRHTAIMISSNDDFVDWESISMN